MKSYLEQLKHGEMHSNEHKSFQESIQTRQEHLKIQQEKQQQSFQLVIDKDKFIDRTRKSILVMHHIKYRSFVESDFSVYPAIWMHS